MPTTGRPGRRDSTPRSPGGGRAGRLIPLPPITSPRQNRQPGQGEAVLEPHSVPNIGGSAGVRWVARRLKDPEAFGPSFNPNVVWPTNLHPPYTGTMYGHPTKGIPGSKLYLIQHFMSLKGKGGYLTPAGKKTISPWGKAVGPLHIAGIPTRTLSGFIYYERQNYFSWLNKKGYRARDPFFYGFNILAPGGVPYSNPEYGRLIQGLNRRYSAAIAARQLRHPSGTVSPKQGKGGPQKFNRMTGQARSEYPWWNPDNPLGQAGTIAAPRRSTAGRSSAKTVSRRMPWDPVLATRRTRR